MTDTVPEASLANFLAGLRAQALVQLGMIANPQTGERQSAPGLATYTIDLLRVLRDKTEGNRTDDEDSLLSAILEELEHLQGRSPS